MKGNDWQIKMEYVLKILSMFLETLLTIQIVGCKIKHETRLIHTFDINQVNGH